ncbi:MAG: acyl-CoA thioesterase [Bacteroidetes bacterium]|nr:acyl-CoA thioesterase [Bacteroidota bacterium]
MIGNDFPIKLEIRIDWSELDYFGHVNNVSFFKYIQASRVNYWDNIGITELHLKINVGSLLASSKCEFKKPLFYPGNIIVRAKVDFIKETSFGFSLQILNAANEVVAEAQDIMVMYDFNKNDKTPFNPALRKKIELIEKRKF